MKSDAAKHNAGHRQRVTKRFLEAPERMESYEVLELLLAKAFPRGDTKPLAKDLLARFGSLAGVLDAHPAELLTVSGVGPAVLSMTVLIREIIARYSEEKVRKKKVVTVFDVADMARCRLSGASGEEVWAAMLDNGNRLLTFEKIRTGSVDHVLFSPRDLVEIAFARKASGIVLVHNHPGGSGPSTLDVETTKKLKHTVELVDLRFIDHLIVHDGEVYSLTQDHLLG